MARKRIGVLASGRGSDLQSLIDAKAGGLLSSTICLVASDRRDALALSRAQQAGIARAAIVLDGSVKAADRRAEQEGRLLEALKAARAELVVLAGYMRILSPEFVAEFPNRIINIHPALLPSFPGLRGPRQALSAGVRIAGCTTHFVDSQVDHGPIILQAAVQVDPADTEEKLAKRILAAEHQILPRSVNLWETDCLEVQGDGVLIDSQDSWVDRVPLIPGVMYGPGY